MDMNSTDRCSAREGVKKSVIMIVSVIIPIIFAIIPVIVILIVSIAVISAIEIIVVVPIVVILNAFAVVIGKVELILLIPVVISIDVCLQHLSGAGVHLVLIFHTAGGELKLIHAVVQLVLMVAEGSTLQTQLCQHQFLGLVLTDMSGILQIALADGHGLRTNAAFLYRLADTVGHLLQKLVAHIDGAFLQL